MDRPMHSKIYREYCYVEPTERISNIVQNLDRLNLVFAIYRTKNTKSQTRTSREKSIRVSVKKGNAYLSTPIYLMYL